MSVFEADCPHCGIRGVALTIVFQKNINKVSDRLWDTLATCGRCGRGTLASFDVPIGASPEGMMNAGRANEIRLTTIYPTVPDTGAPRRTPQRAADYYRQGMENLPNNFDAAGSMFRSALEAGLGEKFPDIEGTLNQRIRGAANQGRLTTDLADWAHQIRLGGNDAVHGREQFSKEDAERLHTFTELVFLYLFTLPGMLEDAQAELADGN